MKAVGKGVIVNTKHILLLPAFFGEFASEFSFKIFPVFFFGRARKGAVRSPHRARAGVTQTCGHHRT
jgi:hypothetical protein